MSPLERVGFLYQGSTYYRLQRLPPYSHGRHRAQLLADTLPRVMTLKDVRRHIYVCDVAVAAALDIVRHNAAFITRDRNPVAYFILLLVRKPLALSSTFAIAPLPRHNHHGPGKERVDSNFIPERVPSISTSSLRA